MSQASMGVGELNRLHAQVADARQHLLDMLRAPYIRMTPWAITKACTYLDHPTRRDTDPPEAPCVCGRRR